MLYRMERAYRREDGTPIPAALVVSYGFSLTTLSGREARAGQVPSSVFEDWGPSGDSGPYHLFQRG